MSEQVTGNLNMDSSGWDKGLSDAQRSAAMFIAHMERLNQVLNAVKAGGLSASEGIARIGGASDFTKEALNDLAAGTGLTVEAVKTMLGATERQIANTLNQIKAGEKSYQQALGKTGDALTEQELDTRMLTKARRELEEQEKKTSAAVRRNLEAAQAPRRAGKRMSNELLLIDSHHNMTPELLQQQRLYRQIVRASQRYGIPHQEPALLPGADNHRKNVAQLQKIKLLLQEQIEQKKHLERIGKRALANDQKALEVTRKETAQLQKQKELEYQRRMKALSREMGGQYSRVRYMTSHMGLNELNKKMKASGRTAGIWRRRISKAVTGVERGVGNATKGVMAFVRATGSARSSMAFMTASFTGLVTMLTGAGIAGLSTFAAEFNHALEKANILIKEGESNIKKLKREVIDLSLKFGLDLKEAALGFRAAISADVKPQNVAQFMEQAAKLATTHDIAIEDATDMMTAFSNAYELAVDDMASLRDVIFVTTDRGRVEVKELHAEIGKIAPIARNAGLSVKELMAAITVSTRAGTNPRLAVTYVKNMLKSLTDPSEGAMKTIRELGLGLSVASIKAKGFGQALQDYADAVKDNPNVTAELADDIRALTAYLTLGKFGIDRYNEVMKEMSDSTSVADQANKKMMDTSQKKWDRLVASMKKAALLVGEDMLKWFDEWIKKIGGVENAQKYIELGFKRIEFGIRAVLSPLNVLMQGLISIWKLYAEIYNKAEKWYDEHREESLQADIDRIQERIDQRGLAKHRTISGRQKWEKGTDELRAKKLEMMNQLDKMAAARSSLIYLDEVDTTKKIWGGLFDAFDDMGDLVELGKEIKSLSNALEQSEADGRVLQKFIDKIGVQTKANRKSVDEAFDPVRDQTERINELVLQTLEDQVTTGVKSLQQWVSDNRGAINEYVRAFKDASKEEYDIAKKATDKRSKLLKEDAKAVKDALKDKKDALKKHQEDLKKFDEQSAKIDQSFADRVFGLEQKGRSKAKQLQALLARALGFEKAGNKSARSGELEDVREQIQRAAEAYESTLETGGNRKRVIGHLERLREELRKVHETERKAKQKSFEEKQKAAAAKLEAERKEIENKRMWLARFGSEARAEGDKLLAKATAVESRFKAMIQLSKEMTRALSDVGLPTEAKFTELKSKLLEIMPGADFFEALNADPVITRLQTLTETIKSLNTELGKVPTWLSDKTYTGFLLRGSSGYNQSSSSVTNVDMRGLNLGVPYSNDPEVINVRRLARELQRMIMRGEAPALVGDNR